MYSYWDQDKEDEKGPDDFNKQLDLQKEETTTRWHFIKQVSDSQELKT